MSLTQTSISPRSFIGLGLVASLLVGELLVVSLLYQHNFLFTCRASAPEVFCAFAGRIVPRALGVLAALGLFAFARRQAIYSMRGHPPQVRTGLAMNLVGFAMVLAPWVIVSDASSGAVVALAVAFWSLGGALATAGLALLLAPLPAWRQLATEHGGILAALILVGMALPELSDQIQPLWRSETVTELTFMAVLKTLGVVGYVVESYPADKVIGAGQFYVAVGPQCSGVEGFALITVFLTLYMVLFRKDLRFPHVLLLFPLGLLLSWCFNVIRIAVLLSIGLEGAPELAIGGFHSHAGWLAFTVLSIGLILFSRSVPIFNKQSGKTAAPKALPPFFRDPVVAQILPFAVFMASALLASTFSETPAVLYPWRVIAMAVGLMVFWPYLRSLPWRFDPLAVATGLAIGVAWVLTSPGPSGAAPFGTLTGIALATWITARLIGTVLLVPIIEELMFRGYIQSRISGDGPVWRAMLGIFIAASLFALLHDRWLAGGLAGIAFGLLFWRSRNITDAIVSHAGANLTIALWALATGAWHII